MGFSTTEKKSGPTISGARALVDGLLREGIDHVFGIPGTQNLAILDELRVTPQIRFILTRHEQGAAFMATALPVLPTNLQWLPSPKAPASPTSLRQLPPRSRATYR